MGPRPAGSRRPCLTSSSPTPRRDADFVSRTTSSLDEDVSKEVWLDTAAHEFQPGRPTIGHVLPACPGCETDQPTPAERRILDEY